MSSYIGYYFEPVTLLHEAIIEGTQVFCNYIRCSYVETFDTVEDAEVAAEIHEERDVE